MKKNPDNVMLTSKTCIRTKIVLGYMYVFFLSKVGLQDKKQYGQLLQK